MRFNILLALLALIVTTSCGRKTDDDRPVIAVSIEPQRNILEHLVGDRFRIVTVMPGVDNPETFEPSPKRRMDVENAELYFTLGVLPFEKMLEKSTVNKERFVNTSEGLDLIYDTHYHQRGEGANAHLHAHRTADPHVWTSLKNVKSMARAMTEKLIEIDAANEENYRQNLIRYSNHIDSLDNAILKKMSDSGIKAFMVWHPSLSYFARDYGLEQISVSSDTKEMSVSALAEVIARASADSVGVMVHQRELDGRQAEMVCKSVGARLITFSPTAYDWEKELTAVVDELVRK